jgi:hydroxypyruvate isomerase
MASCAALAGGLGMVGPARGEEPGAEMLFAKAPLSIAVPLHWFSGTDEEKIAQVAEWGFPAYEWLGTEGDLDALRRKADEVGVKPSCIVGAGSIAPGGMVNPDDHDAVVAQFERQVAAAQQLDCTRLVGLTGNARDDASYDEQMGYVVQCLKRLAPIAEANGVTLVLEALNVLVDHKGFFLTRTDQTMAILEEVNSPNVKMLYDIYHQQITEGNIIRNITQHIDRIGHFHVADNPGRQEPGTGELNYTNIFKAIHKTGYNGYVALECGNSGNVERAIRAVHACLDWE